MRLDLSPACAHLDRMRRWRLKFQEMNLNLTHIVGELDVFADIMSRWANEAYITPEVLDFPILFFVFKARILRIRVS